MSGAKSGAEPRLVTPGEVIETSLEMRSGVGITYENNQYISTRIGWLRENNGTLSVDPIQGSYMPRSGDLVIGYIEAVRNNLWFAEINGAFNGLLPMSLAPWKVEFGAARQHMDIGDVIIARVQEVDESHSVVLTMKGVGLRKLKTDVSKVLVYNCSINLEDQITNTFEIWLQLVIHVLWLGKMEESGLMVNLKAFNLLENLFNSQNNVAIIKIS